MAQLTRHFLLSIGLLWLVESFLLLAPAMAQESNSKILNSTRISELGIGIGGIDIALRVLLRRISSPGQT